MEYFDVCDAQGLPTGETVERTEAHRRGIRHRSAHIWVVNELGGRPMALLQKRSRRKDSYPGCWDISSAGHIQAGDEPLPSALREFSEELGVEAAAEELTFLGCADIRFTAVFHQEVFRDDECAFVYLYRGTLDTAALTLQAEEVEAAAWFDPLSVWDACASHDPRFCVNPDSLRLLLDVLYPA